MNSKELEIPRIVIAAPGSGSGKTTLTMGILAALVKRGLTVQAYKVGPDYIDPAFHSRITHRPSINLPGWMVGEEELISIFQRYAYKAEISIVEGVMGLYDGQGNYPLKGSTAGMAKILQAPVILTMQAKGMSTSAAAIVKGLLDFGPANIVGVVINQPSSENHYRVVKEAIELHTGIPVIGYLPKEEQLEIPSRHLGLIQSSELEDLERTIDRLGFLVESYVDLDLLLEIAQKSSRMKMLLQKEEKKKPSLRIGVAYDKAFSFYYHDNFQVLERLGAELVYFSPLQDSHLPKNCHGLYFGGGYPEVFALELSANVSLRREIKEAAEKGMPMFAECGGYMYLNQGFRDDNGQEFEFVKVFSGVSEMTSRLQNFGYVEIRGMDPNAVIASGQEVRGHEFHRSRLERGQEEPVVDLRKKRKNGGKNWQCGMVYKNVFAMYPHIYFSSDQEIAKKFISKCEQYKKRGSKE